jgi:hypothetical protein
VSDLIGGVMAAALRAAMTRAAPAMSPNNGRQAERTVGDEEDRGDQCGAFVRGRVAITMQNAPLKRDPDRRPPAQLSWSRFPSRRAPI